MNKPNDIESQIPEMRRVLESGKLIEFETHGYSMIPLLHDGGDSVILSQPSFPLNINDMALCKTDEGRYVLHRIISVDEGGYILRGDNCVTTEFCSGDRDVIGVAASFVRKGKKIDVNSKKYLFYVRHRVAFLKLWRAFWCVSDLAVRLFRR